MSRPLRMEYPGACHAMNRRDRREPVSLRSDDYLSFPYVLQEGSLTRNVRTGPSCLMPRNVHLRAQIPDGALSRLLSAAV